jgi:F0F1-type ATP synthase membrane subunit a
MLSGHILIKILIGFVLNLSNAFFKKYFNLCFFIVVNILIIYVVFALEILVCFLQAFVFITLLAVYINDVIDQH